MTNTPWGPSDNSERIAPGIMWYDTPYHGGFHLSAKRQAEMPETLRVESGWYEEDCDWALVVSAFPQFFSEKEFAAAKESVKNWNSERYEKYFENNYNDNQKDI